MEKELTGDGGLLHVERQAIANSQEHAQRNMITGTAVLHRIKAPFAKRVSLVVAAVGTRVAPNPKLLMKGTGPKGLLLVVVDFPRFSDSSSKFAAQAIIYTWRMFACVVSLLLICPFFVFRTRLVLLSSLTIQPEKVPSRLKVPALDFILSWRFSQPDQQASHSLAKKRCLSSWFSSFPTLDLVFSHCNLA